MLRARLGLTQQAFAVALGVSVRAVANYERDRRPASAVMVTLVKLASKHGHRDLFEQYSTCKCCGQEIRA